MTHEESIKHIQFYSRKIGFKFSNDITENDIYNESYILTYDNGKEIKENIKNVLWNELRKYIANKIQQKPLIALHEKKCNDCSEYKNHQEFKVKYNNFMRYLNFRCKTCEDKYQSEWHKKKYATDVEYRNRIKESSKRNKIGKVLTEEQKLKAKEYSRLKWQNDSEFRKKQYAKKKEYYLKNKTQEL
jgi:hypothetical protein